METSSAVHENHGVHHCHNCGWPFPNSHPSAKHRRAHKRVCGTIEGYKLLDSESSPPHGAASDDEYVSDEDQRTQSPKIDEGGMKDLDSGGSVGIKSYKSEDDIFADAVAEFSDSSVSPGVEERFGAAKQLDENVGKELVKDLNESPLTKDDTNAGTTCTTQFLANVEYPQGPLRDAEMSEAEVMGNKINQLEAAKPITDIGIEVTYNGADKLDNLPSNCGPIISESILVSSDTNTNDEYATPKELIPSGVERDTEGMENGSEAKLVISTVDTSAPSASEGPLLESKLEETRGQSPGPVMIEPVVPKTDIKTADLVSEPMFQDYKMFKSSIPLDLGPTDSTQHLSVSSNSQSLEVCDSREDRNEEIHVVSLAETLPAIENPEIKSGEFKNYEVFKSSIPLDLEPIEEIRSVEDNEVTISGIHSGVRSSVPTGSLNYSPYDLNASEDDLQKDGVLAHCEAEVITSVLGMASNECFEPNLSGANPETEVGPILEGSQPQHVTEKLLERVESESSTKECSDTIPLVLPTSQEFFKTTNSNGSENADIDGMEESVHVAPEIGNTDAGDQILVHTIATTGHAENALGSKNGPNSSSSLKRDKNAGTLIPDIAVNVTEGGTQGKVIKHEDGALQFIEQLPNSTHRDGVMVSGQAITPKDVENLDGSSSLQKCSDEGSQRVSDGIDKDNKTEIPQSSVAPVKVSEVNYDEKAASAGDSGLLSKISFIVEDENARNALISETFQDGRDEKIRNEHLNFSVGNSVISSDRSDSLEGNWGSVSVLSTQSDVTAVADTEVPSSSDTRAKEGLEGNLVKPQAAAHEGHPDKADTFEPPSFMTLVEPEERVDKNAASEIQTAQKTEEPKGEELKAGWFPSIINVVNESEGRKKNEEIIAKVSNWSKGKKHSSVKHLLTEAHSETKIKSLNAKQVPVINQAEETALKSNVAAVTTVSSIMGSETPIHDVNKKEIDKEWSSPARYPIEIKKEKRKARPYWVPFVCCSSVHQDV